MSPWNSKYIESIAAIDRQSFRNPWQESTFRAELARRDAFNLVAITPGGEVIAFVCSRVMLAELHLLKVAVAKARREQGIATELTQCVFSWGRKNGVRDVLLEVRPSNRAAIALYRKLGFGCIAVRDRYYPESGEDALVMRKTLLTEKNFCNSKT